MVEKTGLATIIVIFIGVIFALAIFPTVLTNVGEVTKTFTTTNQSIVIPTNGATTNLTDALGRELVTSTAIINSSGDTIANLSLMSGQSSSGALTVQLHRTGNVSPAPQNEASALCTYDYKSDGYDDSSGGRSMLNILLIMAALGIGLISVTALRKWF